MLCLIKICQVKNNEMNLRRALNKKQPKESQVKKAAEAMFGPIGKKENLKQRLLILKHKKKLSQKELKLKESWFT